MTDYNNHPDTKIKYSKKIKETTEFKLELTEKLIRETFKLPSEARISFVVPRGGDYSGVTLDLSDIDLIATWNRVKEYNE